MSAHEELDVPPVPELTPVEVAALMLQHYGLEGSAEELTGEREANFHVRTEAGAQYVFKASCAIQSDSVFDLPDGILLHLEATDPGLPIPRVSRTLAGGTRVALQDGRGRRTEAMLCTYIPGSLMISVPRCRQQRRQCGHLLARLGRALRDFDQASCHRPLIWDLRRFAKVAQLLAELPDALHRPELLDFAAAFCSQVGPALDVLRRQVVHNDLNARNVIVSSADSAQVAGIIDFSDALHTALVADVAVGAVGQVASPEAAREAIAEFVAAYQEVEPLLADELAILNRLVAARLVTNYVVVSWKRALRPEDGHFAAFGPEYFRWRLELALQLAADPRGVRRWL